MSDSSADFILREESYDGYPYSYSCERSNGEGPSLNSTSIFFDFEFVLPHPGEPMQEVIVQDLPVVEFGILYRLSNATWLVGCDVNKQLSDPWLGSDGNAETLPKDNMVLGIASLPPDMPQPLRECRFLGSDDDSELCIPIQGEMTVFHTGSDTAKVEEYILYHLGREINSQRVVIGSILETFFVGRSTQDVAASSRGDLTSAKGSSTSDSVLPLIMAVPVGLLAIIALLVYGVRRKRQHGRMIDHSSSSSSASIMPAAHDEKSLPDQSSPRVATPLPANPSTDQCVAVDVLAEQEEDKEQDSSFTDLEAENESTSIVPTGSTFRDVLSEDSSVNAAQSSVRRPDSPESAVPDLRKTVEESQGNHSAPTDVKAPPPTKEQQDITHEEEATTSAARHSNEPSTSNSIQPEVVRDNVPMSIDTTSTVEKLRTTEAPELIADESSSESNDDCEASGTVGGDDHTDDTVVSETKSSKGMGEGTGNKNEQRDKVIFVGDVHVQQQQQLGLELKTASFDSCEMPAKAGAPTNDKSDPVEVPTSPAPETGVVKARSPTTGESEKPPLPPGSTKTPKQKNHPAERRRRRKKKKKKKAVLTRVSSRENVTQMATVAEADEADSDGDLSESGSEYSWSTEEAESQSNSRNASPSPIRTSRSFSPTTRRRNSDSVETSGDGEMRVPSPVKEEPVIKTLPPPWV